MIIPIKGISINQCWQGRRFATRDYKNWTEQMLYLMPKRTMIKGDVDLEIILNLKSTTRGDIDNFLKPIIDCIVKKGWIEDDRYIQGLNVHKNKSKEESIEIEIYKN